MPEADIWMWHRDYLENLAIEQECTENPYVQEFRDYPEKTGDSGFDHFSIKAINK